MTRIIILLTVFCFFFIPLISAGNLFSFQGRVTDSGGTALTSGDVGITLYHDATGGVPFHWETFDSNINSDGYFSVLIGSTKELDLNYAVHYYLDFNVNNEDFDYGGVERINFESNRGNIPDSNLSNNVALLDQVLSFLASVSFLQGLTVFNQANIFDLNVQNDANFSKQINTRDLNIASGFLQVNDTNYSISDLNSNAQTACSGDSNSVLNSVGECVDISSFYLQGGTYDQNTIFVAKTGGDYNSLWTAINELWNAGDLNNHTIIVMPGTYIEPDTIDINAIQYLSIIGTDHRNTIITHETINASTPTIMINDANHILIKNLHIINPNTGGGGSLPPEAGLQIGPEGTAAIGLHYIYIEDNYIEGVHDSIQLMGYNAPNVEEPFLPTIWLKGNYFVTAHDAVTVKKYSQVYSENNFLIADANYLDPASSIPLSWKTTGIHFSPVSGTDNSNSFFRSTNDVIRVKNFSLVNAIQAYTAGILLYYNGDSPEDITFNGTHIDVIETINDTSRKISGIQLMQQTNIPNFNFLNGYINVRIDNPNASNDVNVLQFDIPTNGNYNINIVNTDLNYSTNGTGTARAISIANNAGLSEIFKFINVRGINDFSTDISDDGNKGTYVLTNTSGEVRAEGFWYGTTQGISSSDYWLCGDSSCTTTCQADINSGIITKVAACS